MESEEIKQKQREKDTGLALLLILLLVLFFTEKMYYLYPALLVLVLTMTWPRAFAPFAIIWFGFSKILGEIVSRILLTLVFFLVALPIGLLRKGMGYDSMKLKQWKTGEESYFKDTGHSVTGDDLKSPF